MTYEYFLFEDSWSHLFIVVSINMFSIFGFETMKLGEVEDEKEW